jgi:hypothetical protein
MSDRVTLEPLGIGDETLPRPTIPRWAAERATERGWKVGADFSPAFVDEETGDTYPGRWDALVYRHETVEDVPLVATLQFNAVADPSAAGWEALLDLADSHWHGLVAEHVTGREEQR